MHAPYDKKQHHNYDKLKENYEVLQSTEPAKPCLACTIAFISFSLLLKQILIVMILCLLSAIEQVGS